MEQNIVNQMVKNKMNAIWGLENGDLLNRYSRLQTVMDETVADVSSQKQIKNKKRHHLILFLRLWFSSTPSLDLKHSMPIKFCLFSWQGNW